MNYNITILLLSIILLLTLDSSAFANSQELMTTNNTQNCSTNNSFYSHTAIFKTDATPKSIEIFKYYCTANLILSVADETLVSFIVC